MPSPDLANYIDLDLRDFDPQDVFELALTNLKASLEDFDPREGQIEIVLLEAIAQQIAELIFAVNRVPSAIFESLLQLYGIERDFGAPPVAQLKFEVATTQGVSIPAGSQAVLELENGMQPIVFTTLAELVIPNGQNFGLIDAIGDRYTDEANGHPSNVILTPLDSLAYVNYIRLNTTPSGGRDTEDDITYFNRGAQRLQRLVTTLVLPDQFASASLELPDVERAFALDNYNPAADPDHNGPYGADPGYVTVAVYGNNEFLSAPRKAEIKTILQNQAQANLVVSVIDPTLTTVNVSVDVVLEDGVDEGEVIQAVDDEITRYLDPMEWLWSKTVRRNELIPIITNVPGVSYVSNLVAPAANVTLTGAANLTTPGTITVNPVSE